MLFSWISVTTVVLIVHSVISADLSINRRVSRQLKDNETPYSLNHPPSVESYIPVSVVYDDPEDIPVQGKSIKQDKSGQEVGELNRKSSIDDSLQEKHDTNAPPTAVQYPFDTVTKTEDDETISKTLSETSQKVENKQTEKIFSTPDRPIDLKLEEDIAIPKGRSIDSSTSPNPIPETSTSSPRLKNRGRAHSRKRVSNRVRKIKANSTLTRNNIHTDTTTEKNIKDTPKVEEKLQIIEENVQKAKLSNDHVTKNTPNQRTTQERDPVVPKIEEKMPKIEENAPKFDGTDLSKDDVTKNTPNQRTTQQRDPVVPKAEEKFPIIEENAPKSDRVGLSKDDVTKNTPYQRTTQQRDPIVPKVEEKLPNIEENAPKFDGTDLSKDDVTKNTPNQRTTQQRNPIVPKVERKLLKVEKLTKVDKINLSSDYNPRNIQYQRRQQQRDPVSPEVEENASKSGRADISNDYISRNTQHQRRTQERDPVVPIVESENFLYAHSGDYHYKYEGGDGTKAFERGELKKVEDGASGAGVVGGYSYTDKDGNDFSLSYTADENGYRPIGAHLPTPPPIPIAIQRALALLATKTTPEPITERANKYH